jgi:predicted metal-dependent phosphotriesterase family hydrolase
MKRRDFLKVASAALPVLSASSLLRADEDKEKKSRVMTVLGEVPSDELGTMLPHEHVLVDFIGADKVSSERYDADEAFRVMLPHLKQASKAGCQAVAECTPAYLGRDPKLLKRLSIESGVKLLTNTGYYGAGQGKYLPQHAFQESVDELANRWIKEWRDGIGDTGIRPGFIKIGVDAGKLTEVNMKLVQAAARCHLETGLTIAGHTGDGQAALQQVDILKQAGVSPSAWIWVHAQSEKNPEIHLQVARSGAWVEFDGVGDSSIEQHVELVQNMKRAGLLGRVLLSHDAGWYSVGESSGGKMRGYDTMFTRFLPALQTAGITPDEINLLTVTNPASAFSRSRHALS